MNTRILIVTVMAMVILGCKKDVYVAPPSSSQAPAPSPTIHSELTTAHEVTLHEADARNALPPLLNGEIVTVALDEANGSKWIPEAANKLGFSLQDETKKTINNGETREFRYKVDGQPSPSNPTYMLVFDLHETADPKSGILRTVTFAGK